MAERRAQQWLTTPARFDAPQHQLAHATSCYSYILCVQATRPALTVATSTPSQLRALPKSVSTTEPTVEAGARPYPAMYRRACAQLTQQGTQVGCRAGPIVGPLCSRSDNSSSSSSSSKNSGCSRVKACSAAACPPLPHPPASPGFAPRAAPPGTVRMAKHTFNRRPFPALECSIPTVSRRIRAAREQLGQLVKLPQSPCSQPSASGASQPHLVARHQQAIQRLARLISCRLQLGADGVCFCMRQTQHLVRDKGYSKARWLPNTQGGGCWHHGSPHDFSCLTRCCASSCRIAFSSISAFTIS